MGGGRAAGSTIGMELKVFTSLSEPVATYRQRIELIDLPYRRCYHTSER